MAELLIGRESEVALLEEKLSSRSAEFIAVYGRRRVGKTYLIKQFFGKKQGIFFEQTGLNDGTTQEQLAIFSERLSQHFYNGAVMGVPENWMAALKQLTFAIENTPKNKRITIFFDEVPWLATNKSGFLKALEYYWNTSWTYRSKLILVVCGSAASWMLKNVIYAKGGLHNRITAKVPLKPFTLRETALYLNYLGIVLNRQQILQIYMVVGGIPHYLKSIRKGQSAVQNINHLCFDTNGLLYNEFDILFHSLYDEPDTYINIIRAISKKSKGISREELINELGVSDGGTLNVRLRSLEDAGFIRIYLPVGHTRRGVHYRIVDEYTLFYLTWIENMRKQNVVTSAETHYWETVLKKSNWNSWAGYAFEAICYKHIDSLKKSLGISHIFSFCSDWQYRSEKKREEDDGAQIDLVFDREDGCITLCEIKYSEKPYLITKEYSKVLQKKTDIFVNKMKTKKQIFWALITSNGAISNDYLKSQIHKVITLDDFF